MKNLCLLSMLVFLASCSERTYKNSSQPQKYREVSQAGEMRYEAPSEIQPARPLQGERVMVYNASLRLKVKKREGINAQAIALVEGMGGYLLEESEAYLRLRVPADSLERAMAAMNRLGKVEDKNVTGQDVTDELADLNLRLDNAQQARRRYLELLEKATTVTEILPIEKELERLLREIESLKGQLQRMEEHIAFSTLTVFVVEKVKPGPLGWVFYGLYEGVKFLFVWD